MTQVPVVLNVIGDFGVDSTPTPAVQLTRPSLWADNRNTHNSINDGGNVMALGSAYADDDQWLIYWGENRNAVIARRTIPEEVWDAQEITETDFVAEIGLAVPDLHNHFAMALDTDGYIHVSGNMHADGLRYVRSTNPRDITAWDRPTMVGSNEVHVSYPQFVRMHDGTLLFFYRDGYSGSGHYVCNRYNTASKTWSRLGGTHFLLGTKSWVDPTRADGPQDENPYVWRFVPTKDGRIACFWIWHRSRYPYMQIAAGSNGQTAASLTGSATVHVTYPVGFDSNDIVAPGPVVVFVQEGRQVAFTFTGKTATTFTGCQVIQGSGGVFQTGDYALESSDPSFAFLTGCGGNGTMGATNANGTARSLPLSHANCEIIFREGALSWGGSAAVDDAGHPHAAMTLRDENGNKGNYGHVYHDGSVWHRDIVTRMTQLNGFSTQAPVSDYYHGNYQATIIRPTMLCHKDRSYIVYRAHTDGMRDNVWCVDCTPGEELNTFPIFGMDLHDWEAVVDTRAIDERGELHLWVSPSFAENDLTITNPIAMSYGGDLNWRYQAAMVLSIPFDRLWQVSSRLARIPRVETIITSTEPSLTTAPPEYTSGSLTTVVGPLVTHAQDLVGRLLFARFECRMKLSTTAMSARVVLRFLGGDNVVFYDIAEINQAGSDPRFGADFVWRATPWVPIRHLVEDTPGTLFSDGSGYFFLQAQVTSGAGSLAIARPQIRIGTFPDHPLAI